MTKNIVILEYIKRNPGCNFKDILKKNKVTEITIKKILLDLLEKEYIYLYKNKYFEKTYKIQEKQIDIDKDTFFGVSIPTEDKNKIKYIYNKIIKYWTKSKKEFPRHTILYKITVEINNKLNLKLPMVWYKFGRIPIIAYNNVDTSCNINYENIIPDKKIKEIVINNLKLNSRDIKLKQYYSDETNYNKLYTTKEQMLEKLQQNKFESIKEKFEIVLDNLPYYKDENKTVDKFYEFLIKYNKLKKNTQKQNKYLYYRIFNKFWDIIAIFNFVNSLKEYYFEKNIDSYNIQRYVEPQLKSEIFEFNILLDEFNNIYINNKEDPLLFLMLDR